MAYGIETFFGGAGTLYSTKQCNEIGRTSVKEGTHSFYVRSYQGTARAMPLYTSSAFSLNGTGLYISSVKVSGTKVTYTAKKAYMCPAALHLVIFCQK